MLRHSSTTSASALSPPPFDLLGISWGSPGELLGRCCARARVSSYPARIACAAIATRTPPPLLPATLACGLLVRAPATLAYSLASCHFLHTGWGGASVRHATAARFDRGRGAG